MREELDSRISYSGLPEFDEVDSKLITKTLNMFMQKFPNEDNRLEIHHKSHKDTGGLKTKHSIHAKIYSPGVTLKAEAYGWSFISVLQDVLKKLKSQTD